MRDRTATGREWEIVQRTHLAILKSHTVLQAATSDSNIVKLPLVSGQSDPAIWLANALRAEFVQNSEILSLSLSVPETQSKQAAKLLDSVVDAYLEVAASDEEQYASHQIADRKRECDWLVDQIQDLSNEIAKLKSQRGSDDPEVRLLQLKADRLLRQVDELSVDIESLESSGVPPRAKQIQRATVVN